MKSTLKKRRESFSSSTEGEKRKRNCNICSIQFHPKTPFDRYCPTCKEHSELLKFSEWLPELDTDVDLKKIA